MQLIPGFLSEGRFEELVELSKGALIHMIEHGEVPAFVGSPMTAEQAVGYLEGFLDRHKQTLIESGVDFLASFAQKIAYGVDDQPIEEFEASLASLTDEQLVELSQGEAADIEALKKDVIDRRRALVADALDTGKMLLRGAITTGLQALMRQLEPLEILGHGGTSSAPAGSADGTAGEASGADGGRPDQG